MVYYTLSHANGGEKHDGTALLLSSVILFEDVRKECLDLKAGCIPTYIYIFGTK